VLGAGADGGERVGAGAVGAGRTDGTGARRRWKSGRASPRDCPTLPPSPPPARGCVSAAVLLTCSCAESRPPARRVGEVWDADEDEVWGAGGGRQSRADVLGISTLGVCVFTKAPCLARPSCSFPSSPQPDTDRPSLRRTHAPGFGYGAGCPLHSTLHALYTWASTRCPLRRCDGRPDTAMVAQIRAGGA
jgi:hypothetical protein